MVVSRILSWLPQFLGTVLASELQVTMFIGECAKIALAH